MRESLKKLLRPVYDAFKRTAPAKAFLDRELRALGAQSWSAYLIDDFVHGPCGRDYGVTAEEKRQFAAQFQRNTETIESGTSALVHVILARAILSIPPRLDGAVVECGVWKGASSASLSLICQRVGRRLKVCDSFQGLPDDGARRHLGLHTGVYGHYQAGMFLGTLEEVRENIRRQGALDTCDFIAGFFNESLKTLSEPVAFAFLDVDLESSTRDCLQALWPLLAEDAFVYSDDAGDLDVVKVYFDDPWWRGRLGCAAPGFVGGGCGLPLSPTYSSLGYTRKLGPFRESEWKKAPFLHYPEGDPGQSAS